MSISFSENSARTMAINVPYPVAHIDAIKRIILNSRKRPERSWDLFDGIVYIFL